jgi:hypothetical protein
MDFADSVLLEGIEGDTGASADVEFADFRTVRTRVLQLACNAMLVYAISGLLDSCHA